MLPEKSVGTPGIHSWGAVRGTAECRKDLLDMATSRGEACYMEVLAQLNGFHRNGEMYFVHFGPGKTLVEGHDGRFSTESNNAHAHPQAPESFFRKSRKLCEEGPWLWTQPWNLLPPEHPLVRAWALDLMAKHRGNGGFATAFGAVYGAEEAARMADSPFGKLLTAKDGKGPGRFQAMAIAAGSSPRLVKSLGSLEGVAKRLCAGGDPSPALQEIRDRFKVGVQVSNGDLVVEGVAFPYQPCGRTVPYAQGVSAALDHLVQVLIIRSEGAVSEKTATSPNQSPSWLGRLERALPWRK